MMSKPTYSSPRSCNLLSVIVPCFNEQEVIHTMYRHTVAALEKVPDLNFEILYVDDGSRDTTLDILRELHGNDPRVRVIALSRNFGKQIAVTAGMENADGNVAVLLDADLQDPPELISEMLARWREGADVVYGVRTSRKGESLFKIWTSNLFLKIINSISEFDIPRQSGDFRLMDRKVMEAFLAMPERNRFVHGMLNWVGFRQEPVYFQRPPRKAGTTKYPLRMMLGLAMNAVTSFSIHPLRLTTWAGFLTSGLALLSIIYVLAVRIFTDNWVSGWAITLTAILFLGGIQLLIIGILGEYVGRIYDEVKQRPLYLVKERMGFATTARESPERSQKSISE